MQRSDDFKKNPSETVNTPVTFFSATSEKPINKILDILEIPFNESRYQEAKKLGNCITKEEESRIVLDRIHAPGNKPGSGFGIAKFRELVIRSIELGCPGEIVTEASTSYGSPHLFYLYMGMVPDSTHKESYVQRQYGSDGEKALRTLSRCKEWNVESLEKLRKTIKTTKTILQSELQLAEPISLDDIIKNKDFILTLKDKKLEYLQEIFIPTLLEILIAEPQNKYPDTSVLGSLHMHLTKKGFERWEYCIKNNLEFVPFKNFEHLDLTLEQQQSLNVILNQRTNVSVNKTSIQAEEPKKEEPKKEEPEKIVNLANQDSPGEKQLLEIQTSSENIDKQKEEKSVLPEKSLTPMIPGLPPISSDKVQLENEAKNASEKARQYDTEVPFLKTKKSMLDRLNKIFNPVETVRYESDCLPDSRILHISLLEKIWDAFQVFDGGTEFLENGQFKRFKWDARPGIFDYITLGFFRLIHFLHSALKINSLRQIDKENREHGYSWGMRVAAIALAALTFPLLFPLHLLHWIGNGFIRHVFSAVMTLAVLPIILLTHGISSIIRWKKEKELAKFTNSLNIVLEKNVGNISKDSTVTLTSVLGATPLHEIKVEKVPNKKDTLRIALPVIKGGKESWDWIGNIKFPKDNPNFKKFMQVNFFARKTVATGPNECLPRYREDLIYKRQRSAPAA